MPDLYPLNAPDDEPAAPSPWISLADLILATLATVVVIGMVLLCLYQLRMKSMEKKLKEFEGMELVRPEDKTWLDDNRHREFLPNWMEAVSQQDKTWLDNNRHRKFLPDGMEAVSQQDKAWLDDNRHREFLQDGMKAISKQDHEAWLAKRDKEVLEADFVAVKKDDWRAAQDALKAQKGIPNKPIVLGLDEVKGFRFDPGSADLTQDFKDKLEGDVFSKIKDVVQNYGIEVLEIVGHTDGTPLGSPRGNLDQSLNDLKLDSIDHRFVSSLKGGSNADLGLMRALSVASYLHDLTSRSENHQIRSLVFRSYSAAQLIDPKEDIIRGAPNLDIGERRRIELRFTRKSISLRE